MRKSATALVLALGLGLGANPASAQQRESQNVDVLPTGTEAPDFALPGATRYGMLADDVRLSDYRGQVVVLAFWGAQACPCFRVSCWITMSFFEGVNLSQSAGIPFPSWLDSFV